jgi:type III pantothenate kinase
MNTLCIDIGNTRTKIAVCNASMQPQVEVVSAENIYERINALKETCHRVVLSTVKLPDEKLNTLLQAFPEFVEVAYNMKLPIKITYETPKTLGKDRIALACAAARQFPKGNTLIIALGTCITYNFIDEKAQFLGGGISPGLQMRLKAMHHFTDKLPLVSLQKDISLLGTSTEASLQSGAFYGFVHEIEGTIAAYAHQYSKFNVVLTGGDMPQVATHLKSKIFADQNFLFSGLYTIGEYYFNSDTLLL